MEGLHAAYYCVLPSFNMFHFSLFINYPLMFLNILLKRLFLSTQFFSFISKSMLPIELEITPQSQDIIFFIYLCHSINFAFPSVFFMWFLDLSTLLCHSIVILRDLSDDNGETCFKASPCWFWINYKSHHTRPNETTN
jgi:hypothetical protein